MHQIQSPGETWSRSKPLSDLPENRKLEGNLQRVLVMNYVCWLNTREDPGNYPFFLQEDDREDFRRVLISDSFHLVGSTDGYFDLSPTHTHTPVRYCRCISTSRTIHNVTIHSAFSHSETSGELMCCTCPTISQQLEQSGS